ncbi:hypothetical protein ACFL2U_01095 [Patescibacteria group bacterium]
MARSNKKKDPVKKWLASLDPMAREMILVLLEEGFIVLDQEPYQEEVVIAGQEVKLPFTNSVLKILLHKVEDKWHYVTRWYADEKMPERLEIAYDMYSDMSEMALDYEMGRQGIMMLPMKHGEEHPQFPQNGTRDAPKTLFKHEPPATASCVMAVKMETSRLGNFNLYTPLVRCYRL